MGMEYIFRYTNTTIEEKPKYRANNPTQHVHQRTYGHNPMHICVESSYLLYLQTKVQKERKKRNKVISVYVPISPGAPHTHLVGYLAPCS